jgi:hypothetical protein
VTEAPDAIACTLGVEDVPARLAEWQSVLNVVRARSPIPDGVRLEFAGDAPIEEIVRLARAEHECCAFFSFAVTIDGRGPALEVTAPSAARPVVDALFGTASG